MKNPVTFARACSVVMLLLSLFNLCSAQSDIPIGQWRMHISYNAIVSVAIGDNIYAAAENGIMVLDKEDHTLLTTYSKINGLSARGIRSIGVEPVSKKVVVVYTDGNLDVIEGNTVYNFDRLKTSTTITGSKGINHIAFNNGLAYLSTDYGVVVFDVQKIEVKETWRDLGSAGSKIAIYQSAIRDDSIFLATQRGVLAGKLTDNLLDFNNWKRFDQGAFNGAVQGIALFQNKLYAAIDNIGIYSYETGTWTLETFLQGLDYKSINSVNNILLVVEGNNLWRDAGSGVSAVIGNGIEKPLFATADNTGTLWVGDGLNGLVAINGAITERYLANGPTSDAGWKLKFGLGKMFALSGGYSSTVQPLNRPGKIDHYEDGMWTTETSTASDLTDLDFAIGSDKTYFVSSLGYGVEQRDNNGGVTFFNENNSTLVNVNPPDPHVNVTAIESANSGLWTANYGVATPLHVYKGSSGWEAFSFSSSLPQYTLDLRVDFSGHIWMVINPAQGGGLWVFDPADVRNAYLNDQNGTGGLPSKIVRSIAVDRDGLIWVGTDKGVAYFTPDVFGTVNAVRPIFENRFLLTDEKITTIKIDAGNRKWIGTERGVWLFNPSGEEQVYNFTEDNSPLLSNVIRDIEINTENGEVFFSTDKGIVSFRGTATEGTSTFQQVKIFPNPVTYNFSGIVGISGLTTDARVKITDVSGKLVWQTNANGGTATWNLQDYKGRRATTGIYLVFAASVDGEERFVGKIAVVE